MRKRKRRFQHACDFLTNALEKGDIAGDGRFPSIGSLAASAGVSKFTMWHAVESLRKKGRIERREPSFSPGNQEPLAPERYEFTVPVRRSKNRLLQERIKREAHNGIFLPGDPLPSLKELAARYGVCQATLRKALSALIEEGILVQRGSRFALAALAVQGSPARSRIMLLGPGRSIGTTITFGYRHQDFLRLLEMACATANLSLDVVCYYRDENGELHLVNGRTKRSVSMDEQSDMQGYVYENTGPESTDDQLLGMIARKARPVALLDETGAWPSRAVLRRHQNVRVFRNTVSDLPARQVARLLLTLGHRRVAFISPLHQWDYSQRRLRGLEGEFALLDDARLMSFTSATQGDYVAQGSARLGLDRLMAFYGKLRNAAPDAYEFSVGQHMAHCAEKCGEARLFEDLEKLMDRALQARDVTAWVAVNDECAHYALHYLSLKGFFVPASLSIIGFDDHPIAVQNGITTVNFSTSAAVNAMLRYTTDPRLFPARKPIVEVESRIVPRSTLGKPRKERLIHRAS